MSAHRSLINKLLLACVAMFAFGFALVPLYDVFCDITGINGKTDKVAAAAPDRIDRAREISVACFGSAAASSATSDRPP